MIYNVLVGFVFIFEFNCVYENKYEVRELFSFLEFEMKVRWVVLNFIIIFMVFIEVDL